ncbi:Fe2+-dependent dioxygenase [Synechococcus sp. MIT S1220]|uniref:Fe2+-dependent dioxygenase n=1 Tax=Synechococcus sp. MIT S1220 TaxID=3082549 RepID=UPI0039B09A04
MDILSTSLLHADEVAQLGDLLISDESLWLDGRLTAGEFAAKVKSNKQLNPSSKECEKATQIVSSRLKAHPLIKSFSLVRRVHSILFSRSEVGDGYGWHVDNPFAKLGRRDLSFTLFLTEPSSYCGGELEVQNMQGSDSYKLAAGEVLIYPSTALHCVREITSGVRLVCVGWIESYVPSHEDRLLLFNLDAGAKGLLARHGRSAELDLIYQAYANAVRRLAG